MAAASNRSILKRRLMMAGVSIGGLSLIGLIWATLLKPAPDHHKVQQIVVLRVQAPPPPPKPPEKPPDPPKPRDEVKLDQPKPLDEPKPAEQPPPAGPLGLDAKGTGPGDGFGLAARQGGRDITLAGSGGGGGLGYTTFASSTARFIAQELARDDELRAANYKVEVRIWLTPSGHVDHYELIRGTGDADLDRRIRDGLAQVGSLRQTVPDGLPQPLRIRVTSSDA